MLLHYQIVTPQKVISEGEAQIIIAPGSEGEFGLLPDHTPFFSTLKKGILKIKEVSKEKQFFIDNGILEIASNKAHILVDSATESE